MFLVHGPTVIIRRGLNDVVAFVHLDKFKCLIIGSGENKISQAWSSVEYAKETVRTRFCLASHDFTVKHGFP